MPTMIGWGVPDVFVADMSLAGKCMPQNVRLLRKRRKM